MAIITISRQFGAGGRTLGEKIIERNSYQLVDEELIEMVAKKANVSRDWVRAIENEPGGGFLKFVAKLPPIRKRYIEGSMTKKQMGYIDEGIYVNLLNEILNRIADDDNAIIIGRGGQYVLRDRKNALHVLLWAEWEDRVAFMEKQYNLNNKQAVQVVNRQGKRRATLYKAFGREDFDKPSLYHLIFNMSRVSMDHAADVVAKIAQDIDNSVQ